MKYLFLLFLLIIIIKFSKLQNYCDRYNICNNCSYCGINNGDKCTCNFYNGYCFNGNSNQLVYDREFITNFDGCYRNEGDMLEICGESFIYIKSGEIYTLKLNPTNIYNFFCYYRVMKQEFNPISNLKIRIEKNGNLSPEFNFFFLIYDKNYNLKKETASNVLITDSYFEINEDNCQNISIYLEFNNPQNIEQLSLTFSYENSTEFIDIIEDTETLYLNQNPSKSSNSKMGLLIGVAIGGVAFIVGIIITVILFKKISNIKSKGNISYNDDNSDIKIMRENIKKAEKLFGELEIKAFNEEIIKDCPKCNICKEDFKQNYIVITTKCEHTFHQKCFQNLVFKDILRPICPTCKSFIFDTDNEIDKKTLSNIPEQVIQTNHVNSNSNINVVNK